MGVWIVTWDGPVAGERAQASWHSRENADIQYRRKMTAGLDPAISNSDDIEDELAAEQIARLA